MDKNFSQKEYYRRYNNNHGKISNHVNNIITSRIYSMDKTKYHPKETFMSNENSSPKYIVFIIISFIIIFGIIYCYFKRCQKQHNNINIIDYKNEFI